MRYCGTSSACSTCPFGSTRQQPFAVTLVFSVMHVEMIDFDLILVRESMQIVTVVGDVVEMFSFKATTAVTLFQTVLIDIEVDVQRIFVMTTPAPAPQYVPSSNNPFADKFLADLPTEVIAPRRAQEFATVR